MLPLRMELAITLTYAVPRCKRRAGRFPRARKWRSGAQNTHFRRER